MSFAWPFALFALVVVPLVVLGYWLMLRRRRRAAVAYSSIAVIRAAAPGRGVWRRHLAFGLLTGALLCLALAAARPQVRTQVALEESAVIMALDVSGSMCATDVDPNRLAAAQDAVRGFIESQDERTRIGLVVFSGFAQVAVAPTTDRDDLVEAVDSLTTGRGTTIGAAILKSVDAIAQINPDVRQTGSQDGAVGGSGDAESDGTPTEAPSGNGSGDEGAGSTTAPEIVVLLTDGANTAGVSPQAAAQVAADRGVRVYPIGFGTSNPTTLVCTAEQGGSAAFGRGFGGGRGGGGGGGNYLVADEGTLREVAATTGGTYFAAQDAEQLQDVLANLPRRVETVDREVEVSWALSALAAALVLLAAGAAVRWGVYPS